MKKYRIIPFLTALLIICLSLCSCGNEGETTQTTSADKVSTTSGQVATLPVVTDEDVNIVFISAGKADSILLMTGGKNYMIDTGEKGKESFKLTDKILKIYDIRTIDGVFISHDHSDHSGGLKRLADNYEVKTVYSAAMHTSEDNIEETTASLGLKHELLNTGDKFSISDKIYFEILAPLALDHSRENNNSMVMMLHANGKKVLFTGDMEFPEEATLLDGSTDLKADVLKVSNHGNPDASSSRFLKAVNPDYAVICTDRTVDEDSANAAVITTLPDTKFYITDEYKLGVFVTISKDGTISVEAK